MLHLETPTSPPLANRQPTESCWWHVAPETVARHHDPYRSHHRSLGRARFLRDESRCRFCERPHRCCFQSTPSLLKPGVPRLRPLPPGWPRSLITIGSGSFSKQSSACVSLAKSRSFPLVDCKFILGLRRIYLPSSSRGGPIYVSLIAERGTRCPQRVERCNNRAVLTWLRCSRIFS